MDESKEKKIAILNNDTYSNSQSNNYSSSILYENFEDNSNNEAKEKEKENTFREIERIKNTKIVCKNCCFFPLIEFIDTSRINLNCLCSYIRYFNIKDFKKEYMIDTKIENKDIICNLHNDTFQSYCEDCKQDICKKCLDTTHHKNHTVLHYILDEKKIEAIKCTIDKYEAKSKEEKQKNPNDVYIIEIFKVLIDYYYYDYRAFENNEIPCKNYIDTINNAYNFLDVLQNQNHRNEDNN